MGGAYTAGRMRGAFFAVSYFVIALVPVLGFLQMSYVRSGTLVADHYQYFADVSLIALFCAGIAKLWAWQRSQMRIATAAVVFCAGDFVGAWGGRELLASHGVTIDVISGPVADSLMGTDYVKRELGLDAANAVNGGEQLAELIKTKLAEWAKK